MGTWNFGNISNTKSQALHESTATDGNKRIHILGPMKYCAKSGTILYFLTCKLLKESKIKSDHKKNTVIQSYDGNIVLDYQIRTHNGWVARFKFLHETGHERDQLAWSSIKMDTDFLQTKLGHPSELCTHATGREWSFILQVFSNPVKVVPWKSKKGNVSKKTIMHSKILREWLFFGISSLSTSIFGVRYAQCNNAKEQVVFERACQDGN